MTKDGVPYQRLASVPAVSPLLETRQPKCCRIHWHQTPLHWHCQTLREDATKGGESRTKIFFIHSFWQYRHLGFSSLYHPIEMNQLMLFVQWHFLGSTIVWLQIKRTHLNCVRITRLTEDFQERRIRHEEEPWEQETFFLEVPAVFVVVKYH